MEKIQDILMKVLGFFFLIFFTIGALYILFFQDTSNHNRLSPAEYNRMKKLYDQGLIEEPMPDGSGYGGKYDW